MYSKAIAGLLFIYLIISVKTISIDHDDYHRSSYQKYPIATSSPLAILNTMLKQNNLPDSNQIQNCFSPQ